MASQYDEDKVEAYCQLAQDIGVGPAITELGYPKSRTTAWKWLSSRGISVELDQLRKRAADMKHFYGEKEQLTLLSEALERIFEKISDTKLTADELMKLANAASKTIETMRLVGNQSTQIVETIDQLDSELRTLLQEARTELT